MDAGRAEEEGGGGRRLAAGDTITESTFAKPSSRVREREATTGNTTLSAPDGAPPGEVGSPRGATPTLRDADATGRRHAPPRPADVRRRRCLNLMGQTERRPAGSFGQSRNGALGAARPKHAAILSGSSAQYSTKPRGREHAVVEHAASRAPITREREFGASASGAPTPPHPTPFRASSRLNDSRAAAAAADLIFTTCRSRSNNQGAFHK